MPEVIGPVVPRGDFPAAYTEDIQSRRSASPMERRLSDEEELTISMLRRLPSRAQRLFLAQWNIGTVTQNNVRHAAFDIDVATAIAGYEPNALYLATDLYQLGAMTRNSTHLFIVAIQRRPANPGETNLQSRAAAILAFNAGTRAFDRTRSFPFVPVKGGYELGTPTEDWGAHVTICADDAHLWIAAAGDQNRLRAYSLDPTQIWDGYTGAAAEPNRREAYDRWFNDREDSAADRSGLDGAQIVSGQLWVLHENILYIARAGVQNIQVLEADDTVSYEWSSWGLGTHTIADGGEAIAQHYLDFWFNEAEDILYLLSIDASVPGRAASEQRQHVLAIPDFFDNHADPRNTGGRIPQQPATSLTTLATPYAKGIVGNDPDGGTLWLSRGQGDDQELEAYHPTRGTLVVGDGGISPRAPLDLVTPARMQADVQRRQEFFVRLGPLPLSATQNNVVLTADVTQAILDIGFFGATRAAVAGYHFVITRYLLRCLTQPHNAFHPNAGNIRVGDLFPLTPWEQAVNMGALWQDNGLHVPYRIVYPVRLYPHTVADPGSVSISIPDMVAEDTGVFGRRQRDWELYAGLQWIPT